MEILGVAVLGGPVAVVREERFRGAAERLGDEVPDVIHDGRRGGHGRVGREEGVI